jgi:secondary thiamine-phosphate synthase enzyme
VRLELSKITVVTPDLLATARLSVETDGEGFYEISRAVAQFVRDSGAVNGTALLYMRHTSASLVIQENADGDVRADLTTALARLAPSDAGWVHDTEGPDDMPAHVKTMLTGIALHIPVINGALALGRWQGVYVAEHRAQPHAREVILQVIGRRRTAADASDTL